MRAARLVLVLMLLAAMTSAAEAQILPRRRVAVRVGNMMADFGGRMTMEAMNEGLKQATDELGAVLDLRLSLATYAQIQMAPRANLPLKSGTKEDRPGQDCLGLLLAETARLAARLEEEKFSPPVLEKMVLDYEGIPSLKSAAGDVKEGDWSSRKFEAGGRSVTSVERHRPQDPGSKSPKSVHCSLVFLTTKVSRQVRKTIDFDLHLDKEKREGPPVSPWRVRNVQYDGPAVTDEQEK